MKDSSAASSRSRNAMPPPTTRRAAAAASRRATTVIPSSMNNGRASPVDSFISTASEIGMKRKERVFDDAASTTNHRDSSDETKIDVFVRCRGRNEQEVRENSGVVVSTDGVNGKTVELLMGPNALSKKTYLFDGVFSPAADQQMIFDEVVTPVLDEMLKGFNCTIFAYGQTGTGKTYTMYGNISDHTLLPDDAGIIPRVLNSLFHKLDSLPSSPTSGAAPENSVKISFIELYNEELRDLLSVDDKLNLKIFDGDSKRGAATVVQGMEERHITSAKKGIELLRDGSHKRQVAATKCNDLSSRSHTVFTITAYTKRILASGEELASSGKLNLVDLAGSENIRRSGAERKRAAEAGLINRSLLTLGRVINALVDRSEHIPYRESKLTRLLQDSLGGRTKTCIIATVSAATSHLDETISSLDYAFRAKNIKNKPQINLVPKKTLLKEFTVEIERLESELTATRQRNGVYLTHEAYEKLMNESESNRILVKEQREKIETIECKLVRKGQDLLELTSNFDMLKKDSETTKGVLDSTKSLLEQTNAVLTRTRRMLDDETFVRQQHERTEQQLTSLNRELYGGMQLDVVDTTTLIESRLAKFQTEQQGLINALSRRMDTFVKHELDGFDTARADLEKKSTAFERSCREVTAQTTQSKNELSEVLAEVKTLREELKEKIGAGFSDLGEAAIRISEGIMAEVETFHTQLDLSYSNLGMDFRTAFDDISKEISEQRKEMQRLRDEMAEANRQLQRSQSQSVDSLSDLVDKERTLREQENTDLMLRIQNLVEANVQQQQRRIGVIANIPAQLRSAGQSHSAAADSFADGSEQLAERSRSFSDRLNKSRDMMKTRIQSKCATACKHTENLKAATSSVHDETIRIVKEQVQHLHTDMRAFDTIIDSIQEQNNTAHAARERTFSVLASTVQDSYANVGSTFTASFDRVKDLGNDVSEQTDGLRENLPQLGKDVHICRQLAELRQRVEHDKLEEYVHTGQTPTRREYSYPTAVPQTNGSDSFMERMRTQRAEDESSSHSRPKSPSKTLLFADNYGASRQQTEDSSTVMLGMANSATILRELDINTIRNVTTESSVDSMKDMVLPEKGSAGSDALAPFPSLKRPGVISASAASKIPSKKRRPRGTIVANNAILADRESRTMPDLSASVGHGAVFPSKRRLRSHDGEIK
ncbi:P-loop containing nucleoside triphosphate hydrolase protein [Hypoxylon cercidicola]|nr:P-loop containing nucleoside triphosphate hydrolase protein [Hypoxylon cercidicola]